MLRRILFIGVAAAVVWGGAQADEADFPEPGESLKTRDKEPAVPMEDAEKHGARCDYFFEGKQWCD